MINFSVNVTYKLDLKNEEKRSCVIGLKNTIDNRLFDSMPLKLLSLKYVQILKIKILKDIFTSLLMQKSSGMNSTYWVGGVQMHI